MKDITSKEAWIGLAVIAAFLSLAVLLNPVAKGDLLQEIRAYQQAVHIYNQDRLFSYAHQTEVGNVLAYGVLQPDIEQTFPELLNKYAVVQKIKEHYTMHTRQVSHETCSGSGKSRSCTTYYTTEVYWTWDYDGKEEHKSPSYSFLSETFQDKQLYINTTYYIYLNKDTIDQEHLKKTHGSNLYWYIDGDDRYYYQVLPSKVAATIFVKFFKGKVVDPITGGKVLKVNVNTTPEQIIRQKQNFLVIFDVGYYFLWVATIGLIYFFIAYEVLDIQ